MNLKLLIFIFGLICIELVSSNNQFNVKFNKVDGEFNDNVNVLMFNRSRTVEYYDRVYPELGCYDHFAYRFDGCSYGKGKYQYESAICWNKNFKSEYKYPDFWCIFYNEKFKNENIVVWVSKVVCNPNTKTEEIGNCFLQYTLRRGFHHSDEDDIPNPDYESTHLL